MVIVVLIIGSHHCCPPSCIWFMVGSNLAHYHCLRTESLDRRLPQSSMTMTTDTEEVLDSKQLLRRKRYKSSSSKQLSCDGERDSDNDVTNSFDHAAVLKSLTH